MKKLFKYIGIFILLIIIIIGFFTYFGISNQNKYIEDKVNNFVSDPEIKIQTLERIKKVETHPADGLPNELNSFISKLENKYPDNSEVKSLRNSLNKALVLQKEYVIKWKKDLNEKIEREKKLKELEKKKQEAKAQQNIKSNKPIAVSVICNTNAKMGTYMSLMESLRVSEAVEYINYTSGCSFTNMDTPVFTQKNSTVMQRGKFYLVLFNGKNYGATDISIYEKP